VTTDCIYTDDDVLAMLDTLLVAREGDWWDTFYEDRAKPCPFFVNAPDESLARWVDDGLILPGKAIDLGCGGGRNAIFLARRGFAVEGVDYSRKAIDWAEERVKDAGVAVRLRCESVFGLDYAPGSYDLVYDSGCFHHLPPHRRRTYVELATTMLKPGGWFGLTCFRPEGGSGFADHEVYERRSLGGGLGYTEERLRAIWSHGLEVQDFRQMRKPDAESRLFGVDFLWAMLARKPL
jgi:SAM-dependent methyltransferase